MEIIAVNRLKSASILAQINRVLHGYIKEEEWGEYVLSFSNEMGNSAIRSIDFDWGVSLINYDVIFTEDTTFEFEIKKETPLIFPFLSEGSLKVCGNVGKECVEVGVFQNLILSNKSNSGYSFTIPKNVRAKINVIQVIKTNYLQKKHSNQKLLNKIFEPLISKNSEGYFHFGNFSYSLAEEIEKLYKTTDSNIIRSLMLESQVNHILALHLTEHHNHLNDLQLPEPLTFGDLRKIRMLTEFIKNNVGNWVSVRELCAEAGMSPSVLQLGFKTLYGVSARSYMKEIKLREALSQIKETNKTISEVVYSIGLSNRSYFTKIFVERFGMLPTEFKKKFAHQKN